MKKKLCLLIMTLLVLPLNVLATDALQNSSPIALSIILDSAWSNEQEIDDYKSLSRQAVASLKPGDYLEIISGHPGGKSKIRVTQFIKSGSAEEVKNITSLIKNLSCPILSDVDVSKSVDLAFKRLAKTDKNNNFSYVTVIVFTDGKLNNSDVERLRQLSKEFKKRNWSLCITGTYQTNKKLLLAANKDEIKFSLISEAAPVVWIKTQRELTPAEPSVKRGSSLPDIRSATDGANPRSRVDVETRVSITEVPEKASQKPSAATVGDTKPEAEEPNKPALAVTKPGPAKPEPVEVTPPTKPRPKPVKKPFKLSRKLLWLIPIALIAIVAGLFIYGLSGANKFKTNIDSRLSSSRQKEPGILIAKFNGQTHTLGRKDRIGTIHIGKGAGNVIKIPDKSISDRHVKIYKKHNDLMLQNIGKTPITVNSSIVKPNVKQRLIIPSVIELNKNRLNLSVVRPKPNTNNKDNKNGTANGTK